MKRTITLLLALAIMLSLCACGGNGSGDSDTSATPTPSAEQGTPTPNSGEGDDKMSGGVNYPIVTDDSITFTWFQPVMSSVALATYENLYENYSYSQIHKHTGINIKFQNPAVTAAAEQYSLMIASGDYTDLCTSDYTGGGDLAISDGVYLRLNELMDEHAPDYMAILNSNPENLRDATTDEGNRWRFCQITEGLQLQFSGLIIRQDWLDDLGINELPRTYDQLHDVLVQFRDNKTEGPFSLAYTGITRYNTFNGAFGVASYDRNFYYVQNDSKAVLSIATENFREYLRLAKAWYDEKLIDQEFFSHNMNFQIDFDLMYNNKIGLIEEQQARDYYASVGMAPEGAYFEPLWSPVKNVGDQNRVGLNSTIVSGFGTAITTACEQPEIATQYLNYYYTDQGYLDGNFGEEGITYNLDSEGRPVLTPMISEPEGMSVWDAYCTHLIGVGSMRYSWTRSDTDESRANRAVTDERWSNNGQFPDNMPINLAFTAEEGSERSTILADLNTYVETSTVGFIVGTLDLDSDWDNYLSTLESIGASRLTKIYQDSLDRYYAR